jgi:hypothetical protein
MTTNMDVDRTDCKICVLNVDKEREGIGDDDRVLLGLALENSGTYMDRFGTIYARVHVADLLRRNLERTEFNEVATWTFRPIPRNRARRNSGTQET